MNDLERLHALVSGATNATDRDTALAYVGAAKSYGRRIADDLRSVRLQLDALEKELVRRGQGVQAPLLGGEP